MGWNCARCLLLPRLEADPPRYTGFRLQPQPMLPRPPLDRSFASLLPRQPSLRRPLCTSPPQLPRP
jgi:hypothetical protein